MVNISFIHSYSHTLKILNFIYSLFAECIAATLAMGSPRLMQGEPIDSEFAWFMDEKLFTILNSQGTHINGRVYASSDTRNKGCRDIKNLLKLQPFSNGIP